LCSCPTKPCQSGCGPSVRFQSIDTSKLPNVGLCPKLSFSDASGSGRKVPVFAVPMALQADRALMNECRKLGMRRGGGNGDCWVSASAMHGPAVERRFCTVSHSVVAENLGDAKAVVPEYATPTRSLGCSVSGRVAPLGNRGFITPEGERQELTWFRQALEPLDREEAIDAIELRSQGNGNLQVVRSLAGCWPNLKQDSDHGRTIAECGADASRRNKRSSRRMKCSR